MPLKGLLVDWIWLSKESLNLKIWQGNFKRKVNKDWKKKKTQSIQGLWGNYRRGVLRMGILEEGENRGNTWSNYWEFPSNVRRETTDPGSSNNTKLDKCPKKTPRNIIFKVQKIRAKNKSWKKLGREGKEHLIYRETKVRIILNYFSEIKQKESTVRHFKCWWKKTPA